MLHSWCVRTIKHLSALNLLAWYFVDKVIVVELTQDTVALDNFEGKMVALLVDSIVGEE